jgi:ribosomal protein S13
MLCASAKGHRQCVLFFSDTRPSGCCVVRLPSPTVQVKDVKETYLQKVASYIEANFVTGDALRRQIRENVAGEVAISSARGMHHVRLTKHPRGTKTRTPLFARDVKRQG